MSFKSGLPFCFFGEIVDDGAEHTWRCCANSCLLSNLTVHLSHFMSSLAGEVAGFRACVTGIGSGKPFFPIINFSASFSIIVALESGLDRFKYVGSGNVIFGRLGETRFCSDIRESGSFGGFLARFDMRS